MRYVLDQPALVARFVTQMIPHMHEGFGQQPYSAIGVTTDDNELIGGVVYQHRPKFEIMEITGAALPGFRWTREMLRMMYGYPFEQCRCQQVVVMVPADDINIVRQLRTLGYAFSALPRALGRDRDALYCYLTEEAWLNNKIFTRIYNRPVFSHLTGKSAAA
jgi:hypothetical protein